MTRYLVRRATTESSLGIAWPAWWPAYYWTVLTPAGDALPGLWVVLSKHFSWREAIRAADARVMSDWVNDPWAPGWADR